MKGYNISAVNNEQWLYHSDNCGDWQNKLSLKQLHYQIIIYRLQICDLKKKEYLFRYRTILEIRFCE